MSKNATFWTVARKRTTRENGVTYFEGKLLVNGIRYTTLVWVVTDSKTGENAMKVELWGAKRSRMNYRRGGMPW